MTAERRLDFFFDGERGDPWFDPYVIGHPFDAGQSIHRILGGTPLELPLHLTGERDPAIFYDCLQSGVSKQRPCGFLG